jgi:hypothetical protein
LAAGGIDLPGPAGTTPPPPSTGANDGSRRRGPRTGPCQAPIRRAATNPRRAIAGERDPRGGARCRLVSRVTSSSSRRQGLPWPNTAARRARRGCPCAGGSSADGPSRRPPPGGANPAWLVRGRGASRERSSRTSCVSGAFERSSRRVLGAVRQDRSRWRRPARASEPRVANEGPMRDTKLGEECAEPG